MKEIMIYFDVDDTLYDVSDPFKEAFRELFPERTDIDRGELFITFRKHCDELFFEHERGTISLEQMYVLRTKRTFESCGIETDDDRARKFQTLYQQKQKLIRMPEEIEKILEMLKRKGVRMGIISNGPKDHQWDKVRSLSALNWIDERDVLISGEIGFAKPDRRIFHAAEERSGLDSDRLWIVGDSFANDILPALEAGWHAVWFDHRHKKKDSDISPDQIVRSPKELKAVLDMITEAAE